MQEMLFPGPSINSFHTAIYEHCLFILHKLNISNLTLYITVSVLTASQIQIIFIFTFSLSGYLGFRYGVKD